MILFLPPSPVTLFDRLTILLEVQTETFEPGDRVQVRTPNGSWVLGTIVEAMGGGWYSVREDNGTFLANQDSSNLRLVVRARPPEPIDQGNDALPKKPKAKAKAKPVLASAPLQRTWFYSAQTTTQGKKPPSVDPLSGTLSLTGVKTSGARISGRYLSLLIVGKGPLAREKGSFLVQGNRVQWHVELPKKRVRTGTIVYEPRTASLTLGEAVGKNRVVRILSETQSPTALTSHKLGPKRVHVLASAFDEDF